MSKVDRYLEYARAFEDTYQDDDWSRLEPFFTEDAVYETDDEARGREAVFQKLRAGVDAFDRRFDRRLPDFDPPAEEDDRVVMKWRVTYQKEGLPDLVISGVETAVFEGERICRLRDEFDPSAQKAMAEWMSSHGASLAG